MAASSRVGLVLGAGGLLGSAWMIGALPSLAERIGRPLGELELLVGTSAGSVLAAALRCGMTVDELVAHQRGEPVDGVPEPRRLERETGDGLPPLPYPWIGSPRLLARSATSPWKVRPLVAATSVFPVGRARMPSLVHFLGSVQRRIGITEDRWVPGPPVWIPTVDYDTGRRVVFGRAGAPPSTLAEAVQASCAIPGWMAPQVIGGRRYVDGGVASVTSVDLLARDVRRGLELDEVYVLAPLASHDYDRPFAPFTRIERGVRVLLTGQVDREVRALRETGAEVKVITPGPEDLAAFGFNVMNPRRRLRVLETSLRTSARRAAEAETVDAA